MVGIGLVLAGGIGFFAFRTAKTLADPEARKAKALEILDARSIPEGYETGLAMSIPLVADMVQLEGDDRQFVFLRGLRSRADLAAAFDSDDEGFESEFKRAGLQIGRRQTIVARGTVRQGNLEARYLMADGGLGFDASGRRQFHFSNRDHDVDIGAALLLRCAPGEEPAIGLWGGVRADPDADPDDATADQAALAAFVEQFDFCGG